MANSGLELWLWGSLAFAHAWEPLFRACPPQRLNDGACPEKPDQPSARHEGALQQRRLLRHHRHVWRLSPPLTKRATRVARIRVLTGDASLLLKYSLPASAAQDHPHVAVRRINLQLTVGLVIEPVERGPINGRCSSCRNRQSSGDHASSWWGRGPGQVGATAMSPCH